MLRVKLLEAGARAPVVAHPGEDLGYDLFALEGALLDVYKRQAILCFFIQVKKTTIDELHEMLCGKYSVSRNTVASMVGYIHSKLGILRAHKESYKTPMVYFLREEYMDLLTKIVSSSKTST